MNSYHWGCALPGIAAITWWGMLLLIRNVHKAVDTQEGTQKSTLSFEINFRELATLPENHSWFFYVTMVQFPMVLFSEYLVVTHPGFTSSSIRRCRLHSAVLGTAAQLLLIVVAMIDYKFMPNVSGFFFFLELLSMVAQIVCSSISTHGLHRYWSNCRNFFICPMLSILIVVRELAPLAGLSESAKNKCEWVIVFGWPLFHLSTAAEVHDFCGDSHKKVVDPLVDKQENKKETKGDQTKAATGGEAIVEAEQRIPYAKQEKKTEDDKTMATSEDEAVVVEEPRISFDSDIELSQLPKVDCRLANEAT